MLNLVTSIARPALLVAALAFASGGAAASEYKSLDGKTIRMIISAAPNGNVDLFGRLLVKGMETRLPETTFAIQNMGGGNGALALGEMASATGDSITLIELHAGPIYADISGTLKSPIKMTDLQWIGSLSANRRIMLVPRALAGKSFADLKNLGRQVTSLAFDAGTPSEIESMVISALTGLDIRVVSGINEEQRLALLLAGDGDLLLGSYDPKVGALIESGDVGIVLMHGKTDLSEKYPDVAVLADVVKPDAPKDLLGLMESLNLMGRLVAAAPDTDPAVVADLRAVFDSLSTDPAFLATYTEKKQVFSPLPGTEVTKRVQEFVANENVRAILNKIVACGRANDGQAVHCAD